MKVTAIALYQIATYICNTKDLELSSLTKQQELSCRPFKFVVDMFCCSKTVLSHLQTDASFISIRHMVAYYTNYLANHRLKAR